MKEFKAVLRSAFCISAIGLALPAFAQQFEIDSYTIDGGGAMVITTGDYELSGTIGQPDAGTLPGGGYTLEGGFWPGNRVACPYLADMNHNGTIDGADIQMFVECQLSGDVSGCECADLDENEAIDDLDLDLFVAGLTAS